MPRDLTIVLVLKDRAEFTWRWMEYYNQVSLPFKIIIADGGKDPEVEKLSNASLYPNLDYRYVRYPFDKDIPTFLNKLNAVMSMVDTPYTLLTDNDDFFFVDGLKKAVAFLDTNPDYFASRGEIYDFSIKPIDSSDKKGDVYGRMTGFGKILYGPSNTEVTALGRIKEFSRYSIDIAHDVCRTEGIRKTCQILGQSNIIDLQLSDNLMDYLLVTFGKIHRDTGFFMLHQSHVGGLGRKLLQSDPFEWVLTDIWPKDFARMCSLIAAEVVEKDSIPLEEAYNNVMQYYLSFIVMKEIVQKRSERRISQRPPKIVTLGHIFNKNNAIRKLFKYIYTSIKEWRLQVKSDKFIAYSPYHQEIAEIQKFLLQK